MDDVQYRIQETKAIIDCLKSLPFPKRDIISAAKIIERSINNATIETAKKISIPTYWEDDRFIAVYASTGYALKMNLDPESSLSKSLITIDGNTKPDTTTASLLKGVGSLYKKVYNAVLAIYVIRVLKSQGISSEVLTELRQRVAPLDLSKLAYMGPLELNPEINQPYVDHLNVRFKQETKVKFSTMYKCICGESKTTSYQLQIRSLDEGGTVFIQCLACRRVWTSKN